MAGQAEKQIESILKSVQDIAETGGYMKKEINEELLKAVSTIRKYINTLENQLHEKNIENVNNENEVRRQTRGKRQQCRETSGTI